MEDYNRPSSYLDDPPNSRLFLVTSKSITEDIIRERFSPFGEVQDIWVVKDKQTKESKGVSFVKFAKSSQACTAMEEMHGKCLAEGTKPIKVFVHYCLLCCCTLLFFYFPRRLYRPVKFIAQIVCRSVFLGIGGAVEL